MSQLALLGGTPLRPQGLPKYQTLGLEERQAVNEVMDSGVLSQFLGTWSPDFFGGPRVQKLERAWEQRFNVAHAVSVNSATSGLYAAVGAAGVGPGDEVIVSPYTMSASAVAAVVYGAIPVFADIDPDTFCISARTIAEKNHTAHQGHHCCRYLWPAVRLGRHHGAGEELASGDHCRGCGNRPPGRDAAEGAM